MLNIKEQKTNITLKLDKTLKQDAQQLAKDIGLPLNTVVNIYLKGFVRSRAITISALPRLDPEIEEEIVEAIRRYDQSDPKIYRNTYDLMFQLRRMMR